MDIEKRSTGFGAAIIILAVLLRLIGDGLAAPTYALRGDPAGSSIVRLPAAALSATVATQPPQTTAPPEPTVTLPQATIPPLPIVPPSLSFTAADAQYLSLRTATDCGYYPDAEALLLQALSWDLDSGEPTVLILHSHACESYTKEPGQEYTEQADCRTTDAGYNMVSVGDALAAMLEEAGITVLHDRQLHDDPSYNRAYDNAKASIAAYLAAYPSIKLVLDLHRDAASNPDGTHYATSATVNGQSAAQVMFVIGTDYAGGYHPHWEENLSIALKLQALLEKSTPGITRATTLRGSRFNQELSNGAMIIEVGASGNTLTQVSRTLPVLAEAIIALADGANT